MATISEKKSQTDYELIGDTMGLLIPQPVRFCRAQAINGQVFSTSGLDKIKYGFADGENWLNADGTRFIAPTDGIYSFKAAQLASTQAGNTIYKRSMVTVLNADGSIKEELSYNTSDYAGTRNYMLIDDVTVYLKKGEGISILGSMGSGSFTVDTSFGSQKGFATFALIEQRTPYLVANKGALVSSDENGKGKIDDDGTISISGELGTGTDGSKVSISRPDKWNAGIEYDFGGGLYGVRRTGSFISPANTQVVVGLTSFVVNGLVSYGGWWNLGEGSKMAMQSASPGQAYVSWLYERTNDHLIVFGTYTTFERTSGNGQYDVWVTYTK